MSYTFQTILYCDFNGCKHIFTANTRNEDEAAAASQQSGWSLRQQRGWKELHYCPTHSKGTPDGD